MATVLQLQRLDPLPPESPASPSPSAINTGPCLLSPCSSGPSPIHLSRSFAAELLDGFGSTASSPTSISASDHPAPTPGLLCPHLLWSSRPPHLPAPPYLVTPDPLGRLRKKEKSFLQEAPPDTPSPSGLSVPAVCCVPWDCICHCLLPFPW